MNMKNFAKAFGIALLAVWAANNIDFVGDVTNQA